MVDCYRLRSWRIALLVMCILALQLPPPCQAFLVDYPHTTGAAMSSSNLEHRLHRRFAAGLLLQRRMSQNDNSEGDESMDVEEERQRLESLLGVSSQDNNNNNDDGATSQSSSSDLLSLPLSEWKRDIKKTPLLTSIGRERLETEIALLEQLGESDEPIPQLWDLWYSSRGPKAAQELMATERLVAQGQPGAWKEAEELLRALIAREGIHWVEPVNRLATLMFLQSRYEDSLELCLLVLQLKPWHFGALSGIVMVYQGLQDNENMMTYALQRMPPLPKTKEEALKMEQQALLGGGAVETRQTWVYRMVDKAKAALLRDEMGLEESFQNLDPPTKRSDGSVASKSSSEDNQASSVVNDEEDAWQ